MISSEEDRRHVLELSPWRWVYLGTMLLALLLQEGTWRITLSVLEHFETDEGRFQYNFIRYTDYLALFLLYIPSSYVIDIYGVRTSTMISISMTGKLKLITFSAVSSWLCYIDFESTAAFCAGVTSPLMLNAMTKVSTQWFGPKGRTIALMSLLIAFTVPETVVEGLGVLALEKAVYIGLGIANILFLPVLFFILKQELPK